MQPFTKKLWISAGLLAASALLVGFAVSTTVAGDDDRVAQRHKSKIEIVHVDDDGERHVERIEFDDDRPPAFLGVMTDRAGDGGAVIRGIVDESAAEEAGLQEGDVIVEFDGEKIDGPWDLTRSVVGAEPGERVVVEVLRDGRREEVTVELGERERHGFGFGPGRLEGLDKLEMLEGLEDHLEGLGEHFKHLEDFDFEFDMPGLEKMHGMRLFGRHGMNRLRLGVELVQATPELREHLGAPADRGVIVGKVLEEMPAADAGIEVGDVIISANGRKIAGAGDLIEVLVDLSDESIEIEVIRDGRSITLDAYIPDREEEDEVTGPRA